MSQQYEMKDGSGALFKNEEREAEQQPHYKGRIKVGGTEYWLSAWLKESKSGKKYMSLSAQPMTPRRDVPRAAPPVKVDPDFDDDLNF